MLAGGTEDKEHAMSQKLDASPAVIGIDIGKNSFHIVGQNQRGAIVLRQKWSRGQVEARLANLPPCRIGMEACVGAHHLSRTLKALGHDARLMPAKYVRLAEYRNGGLFVDNGVLTFRDEGDAFREHDVASSLVVEWRALTVALLDGVADNVRRRLGLDANALPLAKILEGGTRAAGRRLARERRADASPPVKIISDGTVF
jgi:Protein of unknown function (DUF1688)